MLIIYQSDIYRAFLLEMKILFEWTFIVFCLGNIEII